MTPPPDDLQKLLALEPFVRSLALELVADDADDLVQQTWLRAIEGRGEPRREPQSWLARTVRNLAIDHGRRRRRRDARERSAAADERVPSSADLLIAEERRRQLIAAVDALPTAHRELLLLRYYEGLPPRRIAARLQLPVRRVWHRLHEALVLLRQRLDARNGGDRRAWLVPLATFAAAPRALPWREITGPLTTPWAATTASAAMVTTMTTKTKALGGVVAAMVAALVWIAFGALSAPAPLRDDGGQETRVATAAAADQRPVEPRPAPVEPRIEAVPPAAPAATTAVLVVHVRHADAPHAALGTIVRVLPDGADFRLGARTAAADAEGNARFVDLAPGRASIRAASNPFAQCTVDLAAGATAECTLELPCALQIQGVVVDQAGAPIAGAAVEAGMVGIQGVDVEQVATTGPDGTFAVRGCTTTCVIGARARGYAASRLLFVAGEAGDRRDVRIDLLTQGGVVEGVVADGRGAPVAGAVVRIGLGRTDGILPTDQGADPVPAQVRTDAEGRFTALGVPGGTQPVAVRATGLAPWAGQCEVALGTSVSMRVTLATEATCVGVVRDDEGRPVPGLVVKTGSMGDFVQLRAVTDTSGRYLLAGLPAGRSVLVARHQLLGKAEAEVLAEPGQQTECDLQLSLGLALRGRVVDDAGTPVRGAEIDCRAAGGRPWASHASTDENGRFAIANCPAGTALSLLVHRRGHVDARRDAVDPAGGECEITLPVDRSPRARITGRVLGPDGTDASTLGVSVQALQSRPQVVGSDKPRAGDGAFAIEVQAGTWQLTVESRDFPRVRLGERQLDAGAQWDVGTVQLVRGGRVTVHDERQPHLAYTVLDAADRWCDALAGESSTLRSDLLPPGDYKLLVAGGRSGLAARVLPFTIRADAETTVVVDATPGVVQRIEFVAGTAPLPWSIGFVVRRDGAIVQWGSASHERDRPFAHELCLLPGTYEFATRDLQPPVRATFTVGEQAGPPVRVQLP